MSLKNLQNRYSTYVQNECNWGKNIVNPSRCPAAPIYYKKLNDFIKDSYESSVKDTEKNQQKLLKERIEKKHTRISIQLLTTILIIKLHIRNVLILCT